MIAKIQEHLDLFNFDIRKSKDARFVDQKCTPDIVSFMADCVLNIVATKPIFTIKDMWESEYFIHNCRVIFNKPWANDKKAQSEYNKVLSQPLKLLAYSRLLKVEKLNRCLTFSIENNDLLNYISMKDRNAYIFLYQYFVKVLTDSNFIRHIENYAKNYSQGLNEERNNLYEKYYRLISGNTPTKSVKDIRRMFHKILNVYAVQHNILGSKGKFSMSYSDIMYNRKNWRDINKDKQITRKESVSKEKQEREEIISNYYVQKAMNMIRKMYKESEVKDQWANGEATQIHHIFPRADFPQLAHYLENLIKLTPTQHYTKAHPNNKTQEINKDYQLVCLLAKSDSIEQSLNRGEFIYRKESFVYVINTGLSENLEVNLNFRQIKRELTRIYNTN